MFKFVLATTMLMAVSAASSEVMPPALASGELSFMRFMTRSNALAAENPTRSVECFNSYLPLLNAITAEYQQAYGGCLAAAEVQQNRVDEATKPERLAIETTAKGACAALSECVEKKSSIPYFECFVEEAGDASRVLYGVEQNSTDILDRVREDFRLIQNEENRCTTAAERVYVRETATTYEELQKCLDGKTPVPTTPAPPTVPPTKTTTTTPIPEWAPEDDANARS